MKHNTNKTKKKSNWLYSFIIIICVCIFCYSGFQLASYYYKSYINKKAFSELTDVIGAKREGIKDTSLENTSAEESEAIDEKAQDRLNGYAKLHQQNEDLIGWISIEGTKIDYPVMFTPNNPQYYLRNNFKKEYDGFGVPFVGEGCNIVEPWDNLIIYGHHMKDGSMFTDLMKYEDPEFCNNHPYVYFDLLDSLNTYEIICVFKTTVYDSVGYKYYNFIEANNTEEFDSFLSNCKALELYDTGKTAHYGDQLITLSTCEYSRKNGRMVIIAKKI